MHRSKGLEFPVVYYPDLWEPSLDPDRQEGHARHLPRRRRDADDRRRALRPAVGWSREAEPRRAARRGPAARVRRADAREAPGGRVVGGLVREPRLGAERGCCSRATARGTWRPSGAAVPTDAAATERFRGAAGDRVSVEPSVLGATVSWPGDVLATSELSRRPRSTASWTGGGGAPPSATSPPAPTRRGWRASPRRPSSTTSPRRTRRRVEDDGADALRAVPALLAEHAGGGRGRDAGAPRLRVDGLRGGGSRRGAGRSRSPPRRRGGGSSSATSRVWSRACGPRSRRRWGRWRAASRCATSRAPTGSTSSTSSCRWSAATTRAARH